MGTDCPHIKSYLSLAICFCIIDSLWLMSFSNTSIEELFFLDKIKDLIPINDKTNDRETPAPKPKKNNAITF